MADALGTAKFFIEGEKWAEAKKTLDLVRPYCRSVEQLDAVGACYADARDWRSAVEIAEILYNTVMGEPKNRARDTLIRCLMNANRPDESLRFLDEKEKEGNLSNDDLLNKSVALFMNNQKSASEQVLEYLIRHGKNLSSDMVCRILFNRATHLMMSSNSDMWRQGLKDFFKYGREIKIWKKCPFPQSRQWKGEYIFSKKSKLFVVAEGGIGDEIINFRFCHDIQKKYNVEIIWLTERADIADVFVRHGISCMPSNLVWKNEPNHYWTYSMDLPCSIGIERDSLWQRQYLWAINDPKNELSSFGVKGKKVGIKIQGNPHYEQDLHRSLPYEEVMKAIPVGTTTCLFDIDDDFIQTTTRPHIYLKDLIENWDDTLDFIHQMDVIVTSCTSIAHAASAMNKKVFVLVPIMNYYIWVNGDTKSEWYSNNTVVLHQTKPGKWDDPLKKLNQELKSIL